MSRHTRHKTHTEHDDIPWGMDGRVLADHEDPEYPIAIHGADWWLTKTEVAELITALTKALQEAP